MVVLVVWSRDDHCIGGGRMWASRPCIMVYLVVGARDSEVGGPRGPFCIVSPGGLFLHHPCYHSYSILGVIGGLYRSLFQASLVHALVLGDPFYGYSLLEYRTPPTYSSTTVKYYYFRQFSVDSIQFIK